jgi:tRNA-dihydrouridine synthase
MSKKAKKFSNKTKETEKETDKKVETVYETKAITEENICWAIKEIGKEASVNSIRKHLGQPVFLQFTPKPVWAADQIRAILTELVKSGKVVKTGEKTQVYTMK